MNANSLILYVLCKEELCSIGKIYELTQNIIDHALGMVSHHRYLHYSQVYKVSCIHIYLI